MILEGLVTTISPEGELNIAPMGPIVEPTMKTLIFRPFRESNTYRNLSHLGEGVFHVTDDVLMLAQGAIGRVEPMPDVARASSILGYVIENVCRFYEFRIIRTDDSGERVVMEAEVTEHGSGRDFFGFNRGMHAVLEAAILATRTAFLSLDDMERDYARLEVIVEKTGGPREREAFALLRDHLRREKARRANDSVAGA